MVFGGELKKYRKNKLFLLMFFTLLFITGITFYYSNYRLKFSPEEYREIHRELEGKNLEDVNEFLQEEWEKYGFSELYEIDLHSYRMVIEQLQKETDNVRLYEKYLEKVENQYRENQEISIFQSADSYNEKNFEKIYQSYKNLEVKGKMGIQPILGIEQLIKFSFRDIVGILFLFYCVGVGIFQEKKRGMLSFLQVTYKGRKKQYFLKIAGLTVCMISWEILSFFVCYLIGQQQFGWADFSYAVQSVPMLMQSTYRMTIGTFLAGYLLMRIAVYFGLVVFVTMLSFVISSFAGAVTVASACLGGSFLMYQQISDVDSIPFLKRCNLWQMLRAEDIFGKCIYIRLGNEPIPLWVCVGVFAVFVLACYVIGKLFFQSQQEKIRERKVREKKKNPHTFVFYELKKLWISDLGVVVFCVAVAAQVLLAFYAKPEQTMDDYYYNFYVDKIGSEVTDETQKKLLEEEKRFQELQEQMALEKDDGMLLKLSNEMKPYAAFLEYQSRFYEIQSEKGERRLVKESQYRFLLDNKKYMERTIMILLCVMIFCIPGILQREKETNVEILQKISWHGKTALWRAKVIAGVSMVLPLTIVLFGSLLVKGYLLFPSIDMTASVNSIEKYWSTEIEMSVAAFIMIAFLVRILVVLAILMVEMWCAKKMKNRYNVMFVFAIVMILPIFIGNILPVEGIQILYNAIHTLNVKSVFAFGGYTVVAGVIIGVFYNWGRR